jgi:hypothetical protein
MNALGSLILLVMLIGLFQPACDTDLKITVSFGGRVWPLNSSDINLGPTDPGSKKCFGAISAFGISANDFPDAGPDLDWIFGTPFLVSLLGFSLLFVDIVVFRCNCRQTPILYSEALRHHLVLQSCPLKREVC